jgi:interleukin-1 receptor-associated kinase 1
MRKVSGGSSVAGLWESYLGGHYDSLPFNLSDNGWFFLPPTINLWKYTYSDDGESFHEASFNMIFNFTMSIGQPENLQAKSRLVFAVHPSLHDYMGYPIHMSSSHTSSSSSGTEAGSLVSAQITTVYGTIPDDPRNASLAQIDMESPVNSSSSSSMGSRYSVWIDYDHVEHVMSVSVDATQGTPSTATANGVLKLSSIMPQLASLGFYSSMGQLLGLEAWSLTADRLPYSTSYPLTSNSQAKTKGNNGSTIILSSVLGSAAVVAIIAAVVYVYLNSKYRRWRKEQDKLAKTMQRLPGVPTQVDYTDIRKATKNFHATMKLGKGGFGAVYRCMLPAAALRTGQGMEVAVKKFMREVEDRRYDDFLAEVSIINRLRHKNIVPLVGE